MISASSVSVLAAGSHSQMPPWAYVTLHTCRAVWGLILWLPDFPSLPGLPPCPLSPSCSVTGLDISRAHLPSLSPGNAVLALLCDVLFPIHEHGMFSTPSCSLPVTGHFLLHRWSPLAVSSHGGGARGLSGAFHGAQTPFMEALSS